MERNEIALKDISKVWIEIKAASMKWVKLLDGDGNVMVASRVNQDIPQTQKNIEQLLKLESTLDGTYVIEARQTSKTAKRFYYIVKGINRKTSIAPLATNTEMADYKELIRLEREINEHLNSINILKSENQHLKEQIEILEAEALEAPEPLAEAAPDATTKLMALAETYLPTILDKVLGKFFAPTTEPTPVSEPKAIYRFTPDYYIYLKQLSVSNPQAFNTEIETVKIQFPERLAEINSYFENAN
jgi:hypothetical protein